jgi:glyoxylase-like metal-dependent hydrolase (beta-lactamase superfamily II)
MRISEHCYAVTGLGYLPPWSVNAGFVAGNEVTLIIDTGANALAAATIHGYASAVRPNNRILVIDTEQHFDHIGGNSYFRELGIDVYGHASIERTREEFSAELADFNAQIPNPARRAAREANVFYHRSSLANPNCPIAKPMRFDLGGCDAEILLTPGHTASNLCIWVPGDGVVFTGDCLANRYVPNLDCATVEGWRQWLDSLDRLASLAPGAVVPGHGPVAVGEDAPRLIEAVRSVIEQSISSGFSPTMPNLTTA